MRYLINGMNEAREMSEIYLVFGCYLSSGGVNIVVRGLYVSTLHEKNK